MKGLHKFKALAVLAIAISILVSLTFPVIAAGILPGDTGGRPFTVAMSGGDEAPGPGDPDGSGTAVLTFNPGLGQVCWSLSVVGIDPATAAHIHRAPAGSPGPVVIPLSPPTNGMSSGCAEVDSQLILDIIQNPEEFYVNVHNAIYPAGAIRGQLGR